jgi:hypothetical protein
MNYIATWSGGKESCLACYKIMLEENNVSYLINYISREYKRVYRHGIKPELIRLQAKAMGIPLVQKEFTVSFERQTYSWLRKKFGRKANWFIGLSSAIHKSIIWRLDDVISRKLHISLTKLVPHFTTQYTIRERLKMPYKI